MQENQQDQSNNRRAEDQMRYDRRRSDQPSNADLAAMIRVIGDDVADTNRKMTSLSKAFPLNELGEPDYDGHRVDHVTRIKEAKAMEGYKVEVTKKIVGLLAAFFVGIVGSGSIETIKQTLGVSKQQTPAKVETK